ncbi:MAG: preprotein translocase subunit Sec61beta [Candidatus Micrarchaeia archaeon]
MPTISSPQSQAGIMSFYDAPVKGPKISPKVMLIFMVAIAVIILILDHFAFS